MTTPVVLERFRWWHVAQVLPIEAALFGDEPWTARTFWSELGQVATRHYLVALEDGVAIGYAGLCDYPDEAWVQTMPVGASAPACWSRCSGRPSGSASGGSRSRCGPTTRPPRRCTRGTGSSAPACGAATTSPAASTRWSSSGAPRLAG